VTDSRALESAGGTAGEIGHVTIDERGPVCRCGNRGCLEAFAGAEAVLEPLRRRHGAAITLRRVIALAHEGDLGCQRVIGDAGRSLGLVVAGTCNLLAPERVIVGGELAAAGEYLLGPLRTVAQRSAIASLREMPVLAGVLGERAEVLGAVALVLRESRRYVSGPPAGQPAM
jgi:predicted NBD/HSP70 family sugar kinase